MQSISLSNKKWSLYLIPMNACSSGLSTILPLYILQLGGGVREVALSIFLSNLAVTIGAIFWGKLIDSMHWRRTIIAISSVAIVLVSISTFFLSSIPILIGLSAFVGFFSIGPAPVTNLLIMEKSKKEQWVREFSWTSLISSLGLVIAMVAGYFWLINYDAQSYALICAAIAVSSLALSFAFVRDSDVGFKRAKMDLGLMLATKARQSVSAIQKLHDVDLAKKVVNRISKKEIIYFAAVGMFFLSSNLLFTPYTPFLKENKVSDSEVFLAYTVLHLSKVIFLPFNSKIIQRIGEEKMGVFAYLPRVGGLVLVLGTALFFMGNSYPILAITLVAFIIVEISFTLWSTTTTSSLLKTIPSGKEGSILGVNSSVIGAGLLVGSVISGEVSAQFGYNMTFATAIAALMVSLLLIKKFYRPPNTLVSPELAVQNKKI